MFAAGHAHRPQQIERTTVVSAKVVQVGDVVVRLRDEERHALACAVLARPLVGRHCALEVVERGEHDGHVVQNRGDAFHIMEHHQAFVGALVAFERLGHPILAMKDVGDVQIQPRQAVVVVQGCEDIACTLGGMMCPLVLTQQHQRLD